MAIDEQERARRIALWHAHGYKCFHHGCSIQLNEMDEDHLVPQNLLKLAAHDRATRLAAMGLPANFDIQGLHNLVPSCRYHNLQKSGIELEPHQIALLLAVNSKLVLDVKRLIAYYLSAHSLPKVVQMIRAGLGQRFTLQQLLDEMDSNDWNRQAMIEVLWEADLQSFSTLTYPSLFTAPGDSVKVIGMNFAIVDRLLKSIEHQMPMESVVYLNQDLEVRLLRCGDLDIFFEVNDDEFISIHRVNDNDPVRKAISG